MSLTGDAVSDSIRPRQHEKIWINDLHDIMLIFDNEQTPGFLCFLIANDTSHVKIDIIYTPIRENLYFTDQNIYIID